MCYGSDGAGTSERRASTCAARTRALAPGGVEASSSPCAQGLMGGCHGRFLLDLYAHVAQPSSMTLTETTVAAYVQILTIPIRFRLRVPDGAWRLNSHIHCYEISSENLDTE